MTPAYIVKLDLTTQKTSIKAQKIHGFILETYGMASTSFSFQDNQKRVWFFEETFLLADISMEIVLGMQFLFFSNADFHFYIGELTRRSYTMTKALAITSLVKLINKWEFAKTASNKNAGTFVVYVTTLEVLTAISIHFYRSFQV